MIVAKKLNKQANPYYAEPKDLQFAKPFVQRENAPSTKDIKLKCPLRSRVGENRSAPTPKISCLCLHLSLELLRPPAVICSLPCLAVMPFKLPLHHYLTVYEKWDYCLCMLPAMVLPAVDVC